MAWYRRWPFLAGVIVVVITNAFALGSAIHNRSGKPDSALVLTERELGLPYGNWEISENSGLALRLEWRIVRSEDSPAESSRVRFGSEGNWLDEAKLTELGIKVRPRSSNDGFSYSSSVPADVLLVLEMNGPVYLRQLDRLCALARKSQDKDAEDTCDAERHTRSRLFVMDAGLDRDALRRKYPDTGMYAIVHGQIAAGIVSALSEPRVVGYIRGLSTEEIQVPASMRGPLGDAATRARGYGATLATPFTATIAFGRRLEPWIVGLSAGPAKQR